MIIDTENTFEKFELNRQLLNAIADAGYTEPTPIQNKTIPLTLLGHDVLGIAQTGTGKTAAYLLPVLMKIKYAQGKLPRCLIFAPTRELVIQIDKAVGELAKYTDIRHVALYGGLGPKTQIETIQAGVDIIVSTPGRFMDLYLRGEIGVKDLKVMILDEADKMMDMGFMPQIRSILEVIPRKRQNLLFSATFPEKVERLSYEFLEFPTRVEVSPQATTAETIKQRMFPVPNMQTKINVLEYLFSTAEVQKTIIFTRSKDIADAVYNSLNGRIIPKNQIRVIHANKGQNTRINSMDAFREDVVKVLVATDVAARGIDIEHVTHVINFDVPLIYEDYVHRIGRTGRANNVGEAITFLTPAEEYHIKKIEKIIRMEIPREHIPIEVEIATTPFDENQAMLIEIDNQRKKEDPTFKGAFHEKKNPRPPVKKKSSSAKKSSGLPANVTAKSFSSPRPKNYGFAKNNKSSKRK
ncbi:ATP-dependent RNA helicase RhlE [Emticicia aquatica]|jgi:ATP-dependent RNA helicase RhlE|uniref:ATP-dependent RNA helicase RhlE n=1 Tax=Emticicia aquatica TaxID=1681835 RepID=A0ABM9ARQ6_9BACT|nr:DEAD/DEAH box helicase [Emticicia aquatica]CAH0996373.1 ATP-dependent RNA helicase RhlE [Emticicia aquatica]